MCVRGILLLCGLAASAAVDSPETLASRHPWTYTSDYQLQLCVGRSVGTRQVLTEESVLQASGIRIYTAGDVEAVNGTDVRLKCTFQSSSAINPDVISISWSFRPLKPGREESVFHYQQKPYPPMEGIFRRRITWAGDVMGGDASIIIQQVKFTYNGTYMCQVKNPPDVHGTVGEIRLRVVTTASFSELLLLALAVGGGIAVVVLLLIIIVSCRRCKRKRQRREGEVEAPRKAKKDPTVCHPMRAIHLYLSQTSIEIDSSDEMISEPSTKDSSSSEGPSSDDDSSEDDMGSD
ncbi:myelin protein zero-like protein 2 isoform X2 [Nerophis ophidion]|uniref:myelin protein zero-like protein 2 isoform X2 n=1 Tax=Nerophis ophidion TaxID=159077 RepID=UPI002ADF10F9|nr:myelin protein zero-like protein 2 isoform X2 [Nerophis ophidion]